MSNPSDNLPGFAHKLLHAKEHLQALDAEVRAFLELDPYRPTVDLQSEPGYHLFRMHVAQQPPPILGLLMGDFLHDLRSALDHFVWDLSVLQDPSATPPTEFPLFTSRRGWARTIKDGSLAHDSGLNKIRYLSPAAQACIEGLQPYHRPNATRTRHPLWVLHQLANTDKHRELQPVGFVTINARVTLVGGENAEIASTEIITGAAEDGAIVARVQVRRPDPPRDSKVTLHMQTESTVALSHRDAGQDTQLIPTMRELVQAVVDACNQLCRLSNYPYEFH